MLQKHSAIVAQHDPTAHKKNLRSYTTGFVLSVACTLVAYDLVTMHRFSFRLAAGLIAVLAFAQFLVQLVFFMHLGRESKPRVKLFAFLGMVLVVAILVVGSLWIMSNLNYRMMPSEIEEYLHDQGDL